MGIYFIAAGINKGPKNREKSLDKSFFSVDLKEYLPNDICTKLEEHFPNGRGIYVWGGGQMKGGHLSN